MLALATWEGDRVYVANPRHVMQARDIALLVAEQGIKVVHRGGDGAWRYAIVFFIDDATRRREQ